jgi:hypothetical protein
MNIHSDISQRIVIEQSALPWIASSLAGMQIRTLEGGGEAAARTTAIIELAPGAKIVIWAKRSWCSTGC